MTRAQILSTLLDSPAGIGGLAAGTATFLATPSSANLAAALTDETGSGANVFSASPTLTTPVLTGYTETVYSLSGTDINPVNGTIQSKTLSGNTTFTESIADGQSITLMLNPVTYSVTWPTISWVNSAGSGSAPTLKASVINVIVIWQVASVVYGCWMGSL